MINFGIDATVLAWSDGFAVRVDDAADGDLLVGATLFWATAVCVAAGLALVVMGVLGRRRRLKQNMLFGIRTPLTLKDNAAWEHIHWKAAPWSIAGGLSLVVAALLLLTAGTSSVQFWAVMGGACAAVALLLIGTVMAHRDFKGRQDR